jgi:hypothetical protein
VSSFHHVTLVRDGESEVEELLDEEDGELAAKAGDDLLNLLYDEG